MRSFLARWRACGLLLVLIERIEEFLEEGGEQQRFGVIAWPIWIS